MTIIEALEEVQQDTVGINTFLLADMNEANYDADKLANADLPVMYVMPFPVTDNMVSNGSGILKQSFPLEAFLLTKGTGVTTDYSASEIESEIIAPMRLLARRFIHNLNHHSIIDPETNGVTTVVYDPVYSVADANLFGVVIRATVPVLEQVQNNACLP